MKIKIYLAGSVGLLTVGLLAYEFWKRMEDDIYSMEWQEATLTVLGGLGTSFIIGLVAYLIVLYLDNLHLVITAIVGLTFLAYFFPR